MYQRISPVWFTILCGALTGLGWQSGARSTLAADTPSRHAADKKATGDEEPRVRAPRPDWGVLDLVGGPRHIEKVVFSLDKSFASPEAARFETRDPKILRFLQGS